MAARNCLLAFALFFFLLIYEVGDGFCSFKTGDCGYAFGEDSSVWIQLLGGFNGGECAGCFFKYAHDVLLLILEPTGPGDVSGSKMFKNSMVRFAEAFRKIHQDGR